MRGIFSLEDKAGQGLPFDHLCVPTAVFFLGSFSLLSHAQLTRFTGTGFYPLCVHMHNFCFFKE